MTQERQGGAGASGAGAGARGRDGSAVLLGIGLAALPTGMLLPSRDGLRLCRRPPQARGDPPSCPRARGGDGSPAGRAASRGP